MIIVAWISPQIYNAKASVVSLMFLAEVFQQIKWKDILQARCQRTDPEGLRIANQTVSYLLNLLLIFANQMSLTQSEVRRTDLCIVHLILVP